MIKKLLIVSTAILLLAFLGVGLYGRHLSGKVDQRFSSRRWSIPSTVFSDTTLLYPGQNLNLPLFKEKLSRMGYREVPGHPVRRGEMQPTSDGLIIFLNDLETPWKKRAGFPATVTFSDNTIASIIRNDIRTALPLLEIEPEEIMLFFGLERERRQLVSIKQIPEHLIHAVLAAEDNRFFEHWGVDPRGILRALITNLQRGGIRQGGSTITQQLAKNFFLTPDRTLIRKAEEVLLAFTMELKYAKEEILEIYLNEIYLGQKGSVAINGIGEAAYFYFGKPVQELSLPEAATIAGLIKAPNIYSPYANKETCLARRNAVLKAMQGKGWLSEETCTAQMKTPVAPVGYNVYGKKAPYYIDYLTRQLGQLYQPEDLSALGLSIYTTLDSQVQLAAEQALVEGLRRLERKKNYLGRQGGGDRLQGAVVVMQPKTGHILAMVGGRNYGESQFNRVTQARRQPGSAFKPFVSVAALDTFTPMSMLSNQPRTYEIDGELWEPKNFDADAPEAVTLRQALEQSHNLATVDLAMQTGLDSIVETAGRFGFSTPFKPYPSLALGAFEVIPLELARAYCVFAAGGFIPFPLALKAVSDEDGTVLEQRHLKIARLISRPKAFIMNSLLRGVVDRGTGRSLRNRGIDWPVAGKTGTTNNYRDAWFVGYTPDILALVWVGFDNGDSVKSTGSEAALPIWAELMKAIPHHISKNDFSVPGGIERKIICSDEGGASVSRDCPDPFEEYFLLGDPAASPEADSPGTGAFDKFINGIKTIFGGE